MSMAAKYRMSKRMAEGGDVGMQDTPAPAPKADEMTKSMRKAFHYAAGGPVPCRACGYAEGGFVEEENASGYEEMPEAYHGGDDMIGDIMMGRAQGFSEGGKVANDVGEGQEADKEPNQFDDLVKEDDLEFKESEANSGDDKGDDEEDEDRDLSEAAFKALKKKKDRNPSPA